MTTNQPQLDDLKQMLLRMPHPALVDALCDYAAVDHDLMRHFLVIARVACSQSQEQFIAGIMRDIDCTFGDEQLPDELEWGNQTRFAQVADLIQELLRYGLFDAVIQACERCFELVENVAVVETPEDFLDRCYVPLIRVWILALHGAKIPAAAIAQQVKYLQDKDQYGVFFNLGGDFADELGPDVLRELWSLKPPKVKEPSGQ